MSDLLHHFQAGGWAMYLIAFWLVAALVVIAERLVFLMGITINKDAFVNALQGALAGGDYQRALSVASSANSPLSRIVQAGIAKADRSEHEITSNMDEAALREIPKITKRTPFLALFANLAMLCGLFGTIVGLIKAFGAVGGESVDPSQKARILAEGISEAMNCTAFGLLAAITALVGFAFLNAKTQTLEDDINDAAVIVLNQIVANRHSAGY